MTNRRAAGVTLSLVALGIIMLIAVALVRA